MARVTATEVRQLIELDSGFSDSDLAAFISAANVLTNQVNTEGGITDTTQLKEIERWLAAHFSAIRDVRSDSEDVSDGPSQKFQYKVDLGLAQTQYGQQAMMLDTSGYLSGLNKEAKEGKKRASIQHLNPSDS